MLCTFSFGCFQIYQNKSAKNIAIYLIGTIVPIKCKPKISAVGLFCLDKFEDNQTRTHTTFSECQTYLNLTLGLWLIDLRILLNLYRNFMLRNVSLKSQLRHKRRHRRRSGNTTNFPSKVVERKGKKSFFFCALSPKLSTVMLYFVTTVLCIPFLSAKIYFGLQTRHTMCQAIT